MNITTTAPPRLENTFDAAWDAVKAQLAEKVHELVFFVPGEPKGDARRRPGINKATGKAQTFPTKGNLDARGDVRTAFALALRDNPIPGLPWTGPVKVDIIDCHLPAKSNPAWTGKHCDTKPDWDNSGKLVGDALNLVAWEDDRRIVLGAPAKTWWHTSGKWVRIRFYHPVEKPLHGRVQHPDVPARLDLYHQGTRFGAIFRCEGGRAHATALVIDEDGDLMDEHLFDESHKTQRWKNLAAAEAAVRAAVGL